jgi:fatty acid desaturase
MELDQADRDARLARMLDELDDIETKIEELHPASQVRSMVFVLFLMLVIAAAFVIVLFVPGTWDLAPFLIPLGAFAVVGLKSISTKNEELADLKQERARLTEGPVG